MAKAKMLQDWVKFHSQVKLSGELTNPLNNFLAFVDDVLPKDKAQLFKGLMRFPLKTNEVTGICFDKLSKVFEGRNPVTNFEFKDSDQSDDWSRYRRDVLDEPNVWKTKGWEYFKTEINSILVVDLPQVQVGDKPSPYFYWVTIDRLLGFDASFDGRLKWLAYRDNGRIIVIDDETYRTFSEKEGVIVDELSVNPHGLGYCPAMFFWHESISVDEPFVKKGPLTTQLEDLDWYLFFAISKRNLDLFGSYPIYSGYEQSCDYETDDEYCDRGFLKDSNGKYKFDAHGLIARCPVCGNKRIVGAGSFIEVPAPVEGQPDMKDPIHMLSVDRPSLTYNVDEEERLKNNIISAVVGLTEEINTREALNETHVQAVFENQATILDRIKNGFEKAQRFVDDTICRLRYGDGYIGGEISMGTDFFLHTAATLRERYTESRQAGVPQADLDALHGDLIATQYKNNPTMLRRQQVLAELEPFRHLSMDEVMSLYKEGLITRDDVRVKSNFSNYIRRFERENTNIVDFGSETSRKDKINAIRNAIWGYAKEP